MDKGFDRSAGVGIALLAVLVLVNATVSYRNTRKVHDDASLVARTQEVLTNSGAVHADIRDLEATQRTYLLTGDEVSLGPFRQAVDRTRNRVTQLAALTVDNSGQQARVAVLGGAVERAVERLEETVEVRQRQGLEAAARVVAQGTSKRLLDEADRVVGDIEATEQDLLRTRKGDTEQAYSNAVLFGAASAGFGLLAIGLFAWGLRERNRTQAAVAAVRDQQREWFRTTLASIGDAVIAADTAGRVTFLNPVAEALTGWPTAHATGRPLTEVFHIVNETTRQEVENPAHRALREGVIVGLANHTVLISRDGTERPIDDSAAPIRGEGGAVSGAVLVFRDITERKAAEEAQARLAAVVASSDDVIIGKTLDGVIQFWNAGAERVFGYTAAEALGQSIALIVPPERMDEERDILGRLRRGERVDHFETVRVTKAGRLVDIALTVSPVRDAEGRVIGASKVARDVTERKRAEAERARLVETLELALAAADLGTWEWDPVTDAMTVSRRTGEIYGIDPGRVHLRDRLRALVHPDHRARARSEAVRAVSARADYDIEYPLAEGGRWVAARGRGVFGAAGELTRMLGVVQDVTARKAAEAALRASEGRHRVLAELAAATQALTDPAEIMAASARLLAEHLGVDRCAYAEVDDESVFVITGDHTRGVPSIVGRWPVAAFGPECARQMLANEPYVLADADADPRVGPADLPAYRATAIRAVICVPLHKGGRFTAAMAVHQTVPRHWTPGEVELVSAVVGRCWEALERTRVDRALRESEARYRAIVEATPECVKVVAPDGTLLQMNRAGLAMIEGDGSAIGGCVYNVIAPEDREAYRAFNERVCRGESGALEFDVIGLRGTRRHMETAAVPLAAAEGGFTQLAVTRDVTARRQAEAAVRERDERLQLLLEHATDYAVIISDPGDRVLEWLGGAERITGWRADEAAGRPVALIFTPEDRAAGVPERETRWAAETGRSENTRWHQRKDGAQFFAEGVTVCLRGPAGEVRGFGKVFRDVTARRRSEEGVQFLADASASLAELVDYESTLRRIANIAVRGFADWCVVDILEGGKRRRLAVTRAEPDEVAAARAGDVPGDGIVPHALRTGEPEFVSDLAEVDPVVAPQGAERIARLREWGVRSYLCAPLLSRGRVIGGVTFLSHSARRLFGPDQLRVAQDLAGRVTSAIENAQLYHDLQEQDRRKGEFLATLAHELRNPLAPVRNGVQILRMRVQGEEGLGRTVAMIERQLGHMVHLVDDLLDLSRVSSGKIVLRRERVELKAVVEAAVETTRPAVEAGRHELTVELAGEPLVLDADRTRLAQVLANLLNNAAKYTPAGGRIELTATREGADAVVRVADNGVGIPAEMLPAVFDMFTQVGTSLERSQGGLGIGLTLVKRLVEMHGGQVSAESPGSDRGSTFTVRLPLAADAPRPSDRPVGGSDAPPAGLQILVVDDNRDAAESLRILLDLQGHEVRTAHDGPEALRVLGTYRPHLILLDLGLPGMTGYEVAHRVRESSGLREVALAALTGWGQEEDRRRTREAGFDYHLVKPADAAEIEQILRDISASRGR